MNYIEFNGDKIPIIEIDHYISKTDNEVYVKQFILDWHSDKQEFLFQTSGSTGEPKPILISRKQLIQSANATITALNLKPNQTCLLCINPKFIGGTMMLVRALVNQMNLVFVEASSTPLDEIKVKIDFAAFVPLQVLELLESDYKKLQSINTIIIGGGAVSNNLAKKLKKCPNNIYSTYGMTETSSHIALKKISGNHSKDHFQTLPGISISKDERDCLVITGEVTNYKPVITNDIIELIDKDKFKWIGRYDNIINTGGIKLNAEIIEEKINNLFQSQKIFRDFFIIGTDSEKFGYKVTLIIKGEKDIQGLNLLLKTHLDKYEVPKEVIYKSNFILTPNGKLNKQATLNQL